MAWDHVIEAIATAARCVTMRRGDGVDAAPGVGSVEKEASRGRDEVGGGHAAWMHSSGAGDSLADRKQSNGDKTLTVLAECSNLSASRSRAARMSNFGQVRICWARKNKTIRFVS